MPVKHTETAFSYAAAASGKNSPVAGTKGTMPTENVLKTNPNTDTTVFNPSNGVVAGKLDAVSVTTANEILVAPKKDLSTPSPNGISMQTPFEPPLSVNGTIPEPKDDTKTEPKIQSSDNASSEKLPETENVNGGTKTPDVPKKDLPLAPPPAVNVWKLRAEGFTAKAKVQPLPTTSTGGLKPAVSSKPLEKQGDLKQVERRKSGYRQETGNWEGTSERGASRDNVPYERKDNGREGRDRKKSIEAGRVNGFTNKEDGEYQGVKCCIIRGRS